MAEEDYYHILEIGRDADEVTIKKAYRKLALKWHPDKNADNKEVAESKFKKLSEAYDVLSSSDKRVIYDKYGKDGLTSNGGSGSGLNRHGFAYNYGNGGGGSHFNFRTADDIFRDFFEHDPFGEDILADFFGGGFRGNNVQRSHNGNVSRRMDPFTDPFASFGMRGFGNGFGGFNDDSFFRGTPGGFSSSSSFSSSGGGSFKSSSTVTKNVNGKKVVTKKTTENGKETVEVYENGVLTKRTIDGIPQISGGDNGRHGARIQTSRR